MKILDEQLELCRIAHNQLLDYCKQQYKEKGKTPSQFDLNYLLIPLKQIRPEFSRIYSQVLRNISKRIKDSYTNFFARARRRRTGCTIRRESPLETLLLEKKGKVGHLYRLLPLPPLPPVLPICPNLPRAHIIIYVTTFRNLVLCL